MKKKYEVYGSVTGSFYAGVFEAESGEEAMELANRQVGISLCHQCSDQCEDPVFDATEATEQ